MLKWPLNQSPSLFTCQEILDGCMIITLETNLKRTWKDVKKAHLNWNFQNLFQESNNQNINKWKNVWNRGLGKLICQHLEKQLNHQVIFSQKQEIPIQVSNFHYILILDDSGSMKGDKWSQAKDGALNCIKQLENTDSAKVSVIIFNSNARIVAECQKPNFQEMNNKIVYSGGGICFEPPFKLVLELIEKYHDFNKIQILFYTDGEASYPQNAVDKLCSLSYNIRRLISIIACSGEKYSQQLALLIEKFKQYIQSAELKNSVGRLIYQVNGIINYKIQQQSLSQKSLPFFLNFRYLNYLGFQGFIQYFCIKQFTRINLKIQKFLIKLKICVKRVKTYLFILSQ
ncbi:unnamed protein product [Paramecium pentaurelia]|uniref:VWFA domain-containing protein n=1 Tax=Paramecium pentaurelia TaxID=43138 RepID=A0A8S1XZ63_9CILI|nr:unnamed protein product [Paramecium pentaurelia]